ncbi:MAG: restriction endonuclease subunit S [Candidimonas sp.]|nr:MAG: restriction endonuclease subunit S [Candidimonas sp.]
MSSELPDLPDGWQYLPLNTCSEAASISYGIVQPGRHVGGGVPIIRVNNFRGTHLDFTELMRVDSGIEAKYSRTRLKGGEVLLSIVGSIGQVAIAPEEIIGFNVARAVAVISPLPHIGPEWVALCLRSPLSQYLLGSRANTTVQTTINLKDLRTLPIPIPPQRERRAITSIIASLDDRIALLRETNKTLESIAQAIFKSWFVDFDPVRAKMEGRQPEGMNEETAALFPDSFGEAELGLVPHGWRIGCLANIAKVHKAQLRPDDIPAGTNYVGLEHIPRKSISFDSWGCADEVQSAKATFSRGDILFGKLRPYFHKVVIAPIDGVCSTDILVYRPVTDYHFGFAALHLSSDTLIDYASRLSNGARMPRVGWKDLAAYPIVVPSAPCARAFNDIFQVISDRMMVNVHRMRHLASLRDTLLPRLISGRLRLPEATVVPQEACP